MSNEKIKKLEEHIEECRNILYKKKPKEAESQIKKIKKAYEGTKHFNTKQYDEYDTGFISMLEANSPLQLNRLEGLISKLEVYRAELIDEYNTQKKQNQTNQQNININNQNNNTSNASINQNITIKSTIEDINKIPDNILDKEAKEYLEEILYSIETLKEENKDKAKEKVFKVLKYIIDKGFEVGIAILPYLGEVSKVFR